MLSAAHIRPWEINPTSGYGNRVTVKQAKHAVKAVVPFSVARTLADLLAVQKLEREIGMRRRGVEQQVPQRLWRYSAAMVSGR